MTPCRIPTSIGPGIKSPNIPWPLVLSSGTMYTRAQDNGGKRQAPVENIVLYLGQSEQHLYDKWLASTTTSHSPRRKSSQLRSQPVVHEIPLNSIPHPIHIRTLVWDTITTTICICHWLEYSLLVNTIQPKYTGMTYQKARRRLKTRHWYLDSSVCGR